MLLRKIAASAAAIALAAATPAVAAEASSASALSLAQAGDDSDGHPFFNGDYIIPTVIVIALGLGFYFLLNNDEESSVSP